MSVWSVVGLVVLAGLAAMIVVALLLNRARKAIDALKFDVERL